MRSLMLRIMAGLSALVVVSVAGAAVGLWLASRRLRMTNRMRRRWILNALSLDEDSDRAHSGKRTIVGFFHPFCNAGGGGERVLWTAVACLQREERDVIVLIYTGDAVTLRKDDLIATAAERFGISLDPSTLLFIPLRKRYLVEASTWTRFTLVGQSLGSIVLAWEALSEGVVPDLWIDTMGYAFTYPFIKVLVGTPIGSYTHYPTISSDMLKRVQSRQAGVTNQTTISRSALLTAVKLQYYRVFKMLYAFSLRRADVLLVNSTWTKSHVEELLDLPHSVASQRRAPRQASASSFVAVSPTPSSPNYLSSPGLRLRQNSTFGTPASFASPNTAFPVSSPHQALFLPKLASTSPARSFHRASPTPILLYPPCDTALLSQLDIDVPRERIVLSVAQFRPEKEHQVQLHAFRRYLDIETGKARAGVRLVVAGSCRGPDDEARVVKLRQQAVDLGIQDQVTFVVNASYPELVKWFAKASVGLHTMVDEHFGITVVEFMAAGLIPLAHASAGPLLDILTPYPPRPASPSYPTGFHATDAASFAERMKEILNLSPADQRAFRGRTREAAEARFGREGFEKGWMKAWLELCLISRAE